MISEDDYSRLATQLNLAMLQGKACMLLVIDNSEEQDTLEWFSATNSVYENLGMVSRCAESMNAKPVYIYDKD